MTLLDISFCIAELIVNCGNQGGNKASKDARKNEKSYHAVICSTKVQNHKGLKREWERERKKNVNIKMKMFAKYVVKAYKSTQSTNSESNNYFEKKVSEA